MSFELKTEDRDGQSFLVFVGGIDEEASFPALSLTGEIQVDLSGVTAINSIGIRSWIQWFGERKDVSFVFHKCPKSVVMQMNMVEGFLPAKAQVASMEVPFYCEECDEETEVLFHVGKEILIEGGEVRLNYDASTICKDGSEPELDVSEAKFFRFLLPLEKAAA